MQYLLNLSIDVANALFYLMPAFCYVAALVLAISGAVALYNGGKDPRHGAGYYMLVGATFIVASLLLSFPTVLNLFSATIGGTAHASLGGGLLSYTPANIGTGTLNDSILAVVGLLKPAIQAFGALSILYGLMKLRQIGRASGNPFFNAMVHFALGAVLLNIEPIAQTFIQAS
jgi:hypothetical protein